MFQLIWLKAGGVFSLYIKELNVYEDCCIFIRFKRYFLSLANYLENTDVVL